MNLDSILLDLDGTLWNSVTGVTYAWNKVIGRYPGLRDPISDEEIANCMGFNTEDIGKKIFPSLSQEFRNRLMEECFEEEHCHLRQTGGTLYPGVEETLAYLSLRYKLAIVSNCEAGYIECFLAIHRLKPYISDFECFGATGKEKGENILLVLNRLGSQKSIYVGDMVKDSLAAQFAGIPFVFARYGFGKGKLKPLKWDYAIDAFPELLSLTEK